MKLIIKYMSLVLIMFFCYANVYAFELCEMSTYYAKWLELSAEERQKTIAPAYCEASYTKSFDKSLKIKKYPELNINYKNLEVNRASTSDTYYNSLDHNLVTPAKNQMSTNSCWAFTSNAVVETSALKEGLSSYDLSERHIEYSMTRNGFTNGVKEDGLNRNIGDGGNSLMSASYYFRHEGAILESDMPFENNENKIPLESVKNKKSVLDISNYRTVYNGGFASCSNSQIDYIKENILKYGSVGVSVHFDTSYLKSREYYYFYNEAFSNHAVTIVGWDDTINKNNFNNNPSRDGAWIVKNSWGETFGNNGFFYISYEDKNVCNNVYTFSDISINTYDYAYRSSDVLSNYYNNTSASTYYSSAEFNKSSSGGEYLDKISFESYANTGYKVYYSATNDLSNKSSWTLLKSGTTSEDGVYSVRFNPIKITNTYTIIIEFNDSTGVYAPIACKMPQSSNQYYYLNINYGVNYYSINGSTWYDYATTASGTNGCTPVIYAYTREEATSSPEFSLTKIESSANPIYTFSEDYFTISVTSKNIISYELFGLYVFDEAGGDVTNTFNLQNNISSGKIIIKPTKDSKAGTYIFRLKYDKLFKDISFKVVSLMESNVYDVGSDNIYISLGNSKELGTKTFLNNINVFENGYNILDKNNQDITETTEFIGTGMKIKIKNHYYDIIVKGDVSGDGKIKSNDALIVSRHVVYLSLFEGPYLKAAEVSGDGVIKSNDSLLISRFVVDLQNSL